MRPHRRQPTRLPHSWDSPSKNTGVGCHFLIPCRKVKSESEVVQSCPTLHNPMDCSPPGSSAHGIFQARVLEWGAIAFSREAHYSVIKRNAFVSLLMRWMKLESIIQSEICQKKKHKYHIPTHTYGIWKDNMMIFFMAAIEKQTERIDLWTWE